MAKKVFKFSKRKGVVAAPAGGDVKTVVHSPDTGVISSGFKKRFTPAETADIKTKRTQMRARLLAPT